MNSFVKTISAFSVEMKRCKYKPIPIRLNEAMTAVYELPGRILIKRGKPEKIIISIEKIASAQEVDVILKVFKSNCSVR